MLNLKILITRNSITVDMPLRNLKDIKGLGKQEKGMTFQSVFTVSEIAET